MKAVIVTGGKQYTVAEGDVLYIEKLGAEAEATVKFDVLAVLDGENTKIGTPVVEGAAVEARSSRTARLRRLPYSSTSPRRVRRRRSAIVSLTPRWRSPRSHCNW